MQKYVKSKGVHCPHCGRDEGVSLWRRDDKDDLIYCEADGHGYRIVFEGIHSGYGTPNPEEEYQS